MHRPVYCQQWQLWGLLAATFLWLGLMPASFSAENEAVAPVYQAPGFWDGQWTDASSGYQWSWPDPGDSTDKSGNKPKDNPQHYWIPDPRQFEDIDPEQLIDYQGRHYTPYGQLLVWQTLPLPNGGRLEKGYYQIRLGQYDDGSQKTRLTPEQRSEVLKAFPPPPGKRPPKNAFELEQRIQQVKHVMVVYKTGKVVAVLAIRDQQPMAPPSKPKLKQRIQSLGMGLAPVVKQKEIPLARLVVEQNQRWIELTDGRMRYRSPV